MASLRSRSSEYVIDLSSLLVQKKFIFSANRKNFLLLFRPTPSMWNTLRRFFGSDDKSKVLQKEFAASLSRRLEMWGILGMKRFYCNSLNIPFYLLFTFNHFFIVDMIHFLEYLDLVANFLISSLTYPISPEFSPVPHESPFLELIALLLLG